MSFHPIDPDTWERAEHLAFFRHTAVYLTVQADITRLWEDVHRRGLRLYPALVYCAASVINRHPEFRYGRSPQGALGLWDTVHPLLHGAQTGGT